MKKIIFLLSVILMMTNSCNSSIDNQIKNENIDATVTQTFLPTENPFFSPELETKLYKNPSSFDIQVLAKIPAGSKIYPLGTYFDFVQVEYNNMIGYIPVKTIGRIPFDIPDIQKNSLLPTTQNLLNYVYDINTYFENNSLVIDRLESDEWGGNDIGPFPMVDGQTFKMKFTSIGQPGGFIFLSGKLPGEQFWENRHSLEITPSGQIMIWDGQKETPVFITEIPELQNQEFSVIPRDGNGSVISIVDSAGKEIVELDFNTLSDGSMSDGLFPDGVFYFQLLAGPKSKLMVEKFELQKPPDGKFQQPPVSLHTMADQQGIIFGSTVGYGPSIFNSKYQDTLKRNLMGQRLIFQ